MATLVWALACRRLIIDGPTNLISYVDALDAIAVPTLPFVLPPFVVSTLWQRGDESELTMRVRFLAPDGKQLADMEADSLTFEPQHRRARMNVMMVGVEVPEAGRYSIAIDGGGPEDWQEIHRFDMDIDDGRLQS